MDTPEPQPRPARRVVVASDLPVWEGDSGATQRVLALLRALRGAGVETALYYPARLPAGARKALLEGVPGVAVRVPPLPLLGVRALRRWSGGLGQRHPHPPLQPPLTWERRTAFRRLCRRFKPDAVIVEYARLAYLVEGLDEFLAPAPICVVDTLDVLSLRARRMLEAGLTIEPGVSMEEERDVLTRFDMVVAIQREEAELLRAMLPGVPVVVAGHAPPLASFDFKTEGPVTLIFVAAGGAHNVASLARFLDGVWPALRLALGDAVRLDIVGRVGENFRGRKIEGARIMGLAGDLAEAYAGADIVINPCHVGSGLKIKNLEALAHGKPLVTTPLGAEGMDPGSPAAFRVCGDDAAFTDTLIALAKDEAARRELAGRAHAYAREQLRPEAVFGELLAALGASPPGGH